MAFSSLIHTLQRSPLTEEFLTRWERQGQLYFTGASRLVKGLVSSALVQSRNVPLLVVTATLEEAGRWAVQLEAMGWDTVKFYPTTEASPYESFDPESELTWGQLQILADLVTGARDSSNHSMAIVATERSLQPHLPPVKVFERNCLPLKAGSEWNLRDLGRRLATLGYERTTLVETEGQWSQRGDIIDIFPVSSELPVRLEWFGDELEKIREFDPGTQRTLDAITEVILTPMGFAPMIAEALELPLTPKEESEEPLQAEGWHRYLGAAFGEPASLLDYLPKGTAIAIDELEQCIAHGDRWADHVDDHFQTVIDTQESVDTTAELIKIHRSFADTLLAIDTAPQSFKRVYLSELATDIASDHLPLETPPTPINLAARTLPTMPHQFGKLAEMVRGQLDNKNKVWLISAQPSRSVALLQEHDCPAQFIPSPKDFPAIERCQGQHIATAVKYSGLAELEGFELPTYRIAVVSDREFYGQHTLATPSYVRKRRRAASKQIDPNKLSPGDYVVHRSHGVGQFIKLETLTISNETREYLVLKYADGLLRIAADRVGVLSRYRKISEGKPQLHKM